jgi:hypothetical protein
MPRVLRKTTTFVLLCLLALFTGCEEGADATDVSGNVTYRTQPLANGSVTFYPESGQPVSVGLDAAGLYSAELPPGQYRVAIQAAGIQVPEGWKEGDPEPPPAKLILPPQYSERAKTSLHITVDGDGAPQTENFHLK